MREPNRTEWRDWAAGIEKPTGVMSWECYKLLRRKRFGYELRYLGAIFGGIF